MDRLLTTRQDLVVRAVPVVRDPVDLGLAVRVGPTDRVGLVAPVDRLLLAPVDLVVPEDLGLVVPVGPVDLTVLVAPVDRHRMVPLLLVPLGLVLRMDLADRTDRTGPLVLVGLVLLDRMDPVVRAGLMALVVLADLVDLVDLNTAAPVVLMAPVVPVVPGDPEVPDTASRVGLAAPVDRHRRPTCNKVTMTAVARSGVVRGTHRTASALQVTARPHLRPRTDSGGMVGLLPERRRPTGMVHRLPAVGTVRRPPEAGTHIGTVRHTTSVGGRRTMARSITTATTPHRSSTRCSVAGASGSSVRGFRCIDLSPA